MGIKDLIEKPIVKLVYVNSGTSDPQHCVFEVEVNFKPVNGVVPYPPLKYESERKSITTSESQGPELIAAMVAKIQKYKEKLDFLNNKQLVVDNNLDAWWEA